MRAVTIGTASQNKYACPDCGKPTEPLVFELAGQTRLWARRCPECAAAREAERVARERELQEIHRELAERERRSRINKLFEASNLGARFARATFDTWLPRPGTEKAYEACREYAENWPPSGGRGLILSGPTGSGKSHLAAAIANHLLQHEVPVILQSVPKLLVMYASTQRFSSQVTSEQFIDTLVDADLLILDDLGAQQRGEWAEAVLYTVVDERYRRERPIVVTTNLAPRDLEGAVGTRIMDRLAETCRVITVRATSYRRELAEQRAQ